MVGLAEFLNELNDDSELTDEADDDEIGGVTVQATLLFPRELFKEEHADDRLS